MWYVLDESFLRKCRVLVKLYVLTVCYECPNQKMKFPTWSVGPSEFKDKLDEIVAHLAEVEKGARDFQVTH